MYLIRKGPIELRIATHSNYQYLMIFLTITSRLTTPEPSCPEESSSTLVGSWSPNGHVELQPSAGLEQVDVALTGLLVARLTVNSIGGNSP